MGIVEITLISGFVCWFIIYSGWDERFKEWIYKLDFWDGQNISVMESVLKSDFCYLEPTRYIAHEIR